MIVAGRGPPAESKARATSSGDVSVQLLLSASEKALAPASPILLCRRLQRGEEGQGCWWRDRAAGIEQGVLTYSIHDAYEWHRPGLQPCSVADRHDLGRRSRRR
jgi:hypothetical protein